MTIYEGVDLLWPASDRDGIIAAFATAGTGLIPTAILTSQTFLMSDDVLFDGLDRSTKANLLVDVPRPDSFIELAEIGLFVYDWVDRANAYELVAFPDVPLTIGSISGDLEELARQVTLAISFREATSIAVEKYLICE